MTVADAQSERDDGSPVISIDAMMTGSSGTPALVLKPPRRRARRARRGLRVAWSCMLVLYPRRQAALRAVRSGSRARWGALYAPAVFLPSSQFFLASLGGKSWRIKTGVSSGRVRKLEGRSRCMMHDARARAGGSVPRCRKRKASGAGRAGSVQSEPTGGNGDVTGAIQSESRGGRFAASFVHLLLSLRHTSD